MYKQIINKNLSFMGEKLIRGRHKIHPYPAMLHPLLVNFLLDKYAHQNNVIFDPFCGSGVTLLQSSVKGYQSIGFDINPLALLIAKTKTKSYSKKELAAEYSALKRSLLKSEEIDIPEIKNIEYWYSETVRNDLGKIRAVLKKRTSIYQDFFITCFAYVCRNQSLTRNWEFKRYRLTKDTIGTLQNKVLETFSTHSEKMIEIFGENDVPKKISTPLLKNSENKIPLEIKYDVVITSPPYGDSRTTVAYGQYSSFGYEWTADLNSFGGIDYKIDQESLGKVSPLNEEIYLHDSLKDVAQKIESKDKKRADEVLYFFNGYYNVIKNVVRNLNPGGRVCFVVGNRTVKDIQIPMDQITASFLESFGLNFEGILVRDILNKVMPLKNSPTNKVGANSNTMVNEYIVIFQKGYDLR